MIRIFVTVHAQAKKAAIDQVSEHNYKISVTCSPERGKANRAMIKLLADHLDIAPSRMHIRGGFTKIKKIIEID